MFFFQVLTQRPTGRQGLSNLKVAKLNEVRKLYRFIGLEILDFNEAHIYILFI